MRETTEARELTNEQRVEKIIDAIIKHGRKDRNTMESDSEKFFFKGPRINMSCEYLGGRTEIKIYIKSIYVHIFAMKEGGSEDIKSIELRGMEYGKENKRHTLEESISIVEQIIAEDYPDQTEATKQELATTLGSETK